jgi:poly-gamma-glutamate capsule biosynthesis protein CapA/YwtB (metallophosphatase superfamily)
MVMCLTGCGTTQAQADSSSTSTGSSSVGSPSPTGSPEYRTTESAASFTLTATGDVIGHMPVVRRAQHYSHGSGYDFTPLFSGIAPRISAADLAICHQEMPLSATDTRISGYPLFNTPHELATALAKTGFDRCSTASNHSIDRGQAGIASTLNALDAAHIAHTGTARSAAESRRINIFTVRGVRLAHLSYTYGTNGLRVPADAPWSVNVTSLPAILAEAREARAAGAQFVILSMHWGTEYHVLPTPEQESQARTLLASPDIDLILGDHAHVQQPVRRIAGKYVVYGLGNLIASQSTSAGLPAQTQDGSLITVHVTGTTTARGSDYHVDKITYTPTYCPIGSYRVLPVISALSDPTTPASLRSELKASLRRTKAIQSMGVATLAG